ncbi:uncharacterized protein LOC120345867 [Styela clava]
MKSFGIVMLGAACLVSCVVADCYWEVGCTNTKRKGRQYNVGQKWRPSSNSCYNCKCILAKKFVLECLEVAETQSQSVKKSQISARLSNPVRFAQEENVKITAKEAATKECAPTPAPTYNWSTGTFQPITYRTVHYYYTRKESRCCSLYFAPISVHPLCKVVKVGKCGTKVVLKSNPKESCNMAMSFRG